MFRDLAISIFAIIIGIAAVTYLALVTANGDEDGGNLDEENSIMDNLDNLENNNDDISHGLGDHIEWKSLKEGLLIANKEDKPLMLIIHKSWCGACRSLKPKIRESKEISELSKKFIMVNTEDDDEPTEEIYRPDGGYIPRILFFNPKGELLEDVINVDGNPKFKYYYYDVNSVLNSMNSVVTMFQTPSDSIDQNLNATTDKEDNEKIEL